MTKVYVVVSGFDDSNSSVGKTLQEAWETHKNNHDQDVSDCTFYIAEEVEVEVEIKVKENARRSG
jgi:hypothetical protein